MRLFWLLVSAILGVSGIYVVRHIGKHLQFVEYHHVSIYVEQFFVKKVETSHNKKHLKLKPLEKPISFEEMFEQRRKTASEACLKHLGVNAETFRKQHVDIDLQALSETFYNFTYFNDEHKILFCTIPKVASTNVKDLMFDYHGFTEWKLVRNFPRRLIELRGDEIKSRMNYTKIIFVRNPIERLISTWRDKFSRGVPRDNPQLLTFFGHILKKYRKHPKNRVGYNGFAAITLEEFLDFIRTEGLMPKMIDDHWRSYVCHCDPCRVDYKYIGYFENMEQELRYIMNVTTNGKVSGSLAKPSRNSFAAESLKNATLRSVYGKNLPKQLLEDVAHRYECDFDIFGYEKD